MAAGYRGCQREVLSAAWWPRPVLSSSSAGDWEAAGQETGWGLQGDSPGKMISLLWSQGPSESPPPGPCPVHELKQLGQGTGWGPSQGMNRICKQSAWSDVGLNLKVGGKMPSVYFWSGFGDLIHWEPECLLPIWNSFRAPPAASSRAGLWLSGGGGLGEVRHQGINISVHPPSTSSGTNISKQWAHGRRVTVAVFS